MFLVLAVMAWSLTWLLVSKRKASKVSNKPCERGYLMSKVGR